MSDSSLADRIWYGAGAGAAFGRAALAPLSLAFGAVVRARNALYDAGVFQSAAPTIPVLSVGNLSVGGTGKTPLAAYLALRLKTAGAKPALVMRGVGDDESRAYAVLAPNVPVIADVDRVRGVQSAAGRGCDVAVLDDAFQHRRVRRDLDIVVLSADRNAERLLPAGPLREPVASLARAHCAVITRKAVSLDIAQRVSERVRRAFPKLALLQVALKPVALVASESGDERSIESLRGQRVLAIAGIGDPDAFFEQLGAHGGTVQRRTYADHHAYTDGDAASLATSAAGFDLVVCTLKDAVKLGPRWPRQAPSLWYVSQRLDVEEGESELERMLARLLDLRHSYRL